MLPVEFLGDEVDDDIIPILAPEPVIAIASHHANVVVFDAHDRHVERAAAKVEDENRLVAFQLVEAIGERRRGRLVDDTQHIQPGELAGVKGRGAFRVVEVSRDRDDGVRYRFPEILLRIVLQLLDDERREFFGGVVLAFKLPVKLRLALAHLAFHEIHDLLGLGHRVLLRDGADHGVMPVKQDDRGCDAFALRVGDDLGLSIGIDVSDCAIGRA